MSSFQSQPSVTQSAVRTNSSLHQTKRVGSDLPTYTGELALAALAELSSRNTEGLKYPPSKAASRCLSRFSFLASRAETALCRQGTLLDAFNLSERFSDALSPEIKQRIDRVFHEITRHRSALGMASSGITLDPQNRAAILIAALNKVPEIRDPIFNKKSIIVREEGCGSGLLTSIIYPYLNQQLGTRLSRYIASDLLTEFFDINTQNSSRFVVSNFQTDPLNLVVDSKGQKIEDSAVTEEIRQELIRMSTGVRPTLQVQRHSALVPSMVLLATDNPILTHSRHNLFAPLPESEHADIVFVSNVLVPDYYNDAQRLEALRAIGNNMQHGGLVIVSNQRYSALMTLMGEIVAPSGCSFTCSVFERNNNVLELKAWSRNLMGKGYDDVQTLIPSIAL